MNVSPNGQDEQNTAHPMERLGTTLDRFSKVNLVLAIMLLIGAISLTWTARGVVSEIVHSVDGNTTSMDRMTTSMEEVLERIEANTRASSENLGRIEGIEGQMDRMQGNE